MNLLDESSKLFPNQQSNTTRETPCWSVGEFYTWGDKHSVQRKQVGREINRKSFCQEHKIVSQYKGPNTVLQNGGKTFDIVSQERERF